MAGFFDSEIVREEMESIAKIQDEIFANVFQFASMNKQDKVEHIDKLSTLLEKQKILYTRLKLSDDPDAERMKEEILSNAVALGFSRDVDITYVFSNMTKVLENMRNSLIDKP